MSFGSVGLVGAGEIGHGFARQALAGGYQVVACDIKRTAAADLEKAGAQIVATPAAVAQRAEVIQIAVMNDAQVSEVCLAEDGLLAGGKAGCIIAIHSTIHPRTAREVAARAEERGIDVLDAPVTHPFGVHGIETASASLLIGGSAAALERARPLLERSAGRIFHLGPSGAGAAAKLIRNLVMYITLLAAHEGRALSEAAGIERDLFRDILATSGASSAAMDHFLARTVYDEAYRQRLPTLVEIFEKDVRLAIEYGRELGLQLPAAELVERTVREMLLPHAPSATAIARGFTPGS